MSKPGLRIEEDPATPEVLEIAKNELRESPENIEKGLRELRELLKCDKSINFGDDEKVLIIFLRPCKYYAQSAYELMVRVAEFKEKHRSLLKDLMPDTLKMGFLEHRVVNVLRDRDPKGRRILLVNCGGTWDPSKVPADDVFRMFYLIHESALLEPQTQICGTVVIMDYEGLTMRQVAALTPSYSMRLLSFIQDAMPLRLKEVHMVKQPFIFNMVWSMFKPFVKPKLKSRMFFHGSKMSSLHKHIPPSHLPKNYDGLLPAIDYGSYEWFPILKTGDEFINKMNSYGLVKTSQ